jgi:hypothetical protein
MNSAAQKNKTPRTTWFLLRKRFRFDTHFTVEECITQLTRLHKREEAAVLLVDKPAVELEIYLLSELNSVSEPVIPNFTLFNNTMTIRARLSPNTDGGTLIEGTADALLFPRNLVALIVGIILLISLILAVTSFVYDVFSEDIGASSRMTGYVFLTVVLLTPFLLSIIFSLVERNLFLRFLADLLTGETDRRKSL